jgi:hypothetical protein
MPSRYLTRRRTSSGSCGLSAQGSAKRSTCQLSSPTIGAAIAQLHLGQLNAAQAEVAPVLAMPADFRIATVTGWLADLDSQLAVSKHHDSTLATGMRRQIRAFTAVALPSDAKEARTSDRQAQGPNPDRRDRLG